MLAVAAVTAVRLLASLAPVGPSFPIAPLSFLPSVGFYATLASYANEQVVAVPFQTWTTAPALCLVVPMPMTVASLYPLAGVLIVSATASIFNSLLPLLLLHRLTEHLGRDIPAAIEEHNEQRNGQEHGSVKAAVPVDTFCPVVYRRLCRKT